MDVTHNTPAPVADEPQQWLRLCTTPGVGVVRQRQLLERFGTPSAIFDYGIKQGDLSHSLRTHLSHPDQARIDACMEWLQGERCSLMTLFDADYPPLLRQLADGPSLLFLRGERALVNSPQIAIVGSRNPTRMGEETAHEFGRYLASVGLTITSGLALGIDGAAHRGALSAGGGTIAVQGTGPDRVYPARNRELAHEIIAANGLLLTEFPFGTPPMPGNFPKRNRLICGLSLGTLVVEAALKSGSLQTARLAAEQGREVFAIPGSIHNPLARGCHRLIREGAKLVESGSDLLEELAPQLQHLVVAPSDNQMDTLYNSPVAGDELDPETQSLLELVGDAPTPVDRIIERSGLTANVVSSILLQLELRGYITNIAGGYSRTSMRAHP